ncbi:MAG: type I-U CRISPR-associated protein Csb2 [Nodosilinea sp.]
MIYIHVECHTNQYQACAWGNHHSEGVVDWPPAPWRLLRAIVAGSYNAHLPAAHLPTLKALLHKLAAVLPSYTLPPVTYIQHRSPRPQVNAKTAKVEPGKPLYSAGLMMSSAQNSVHIHWPVALSEPEELVLSLCLAGLTYFGRKEAVATWQLVEEAPESNAISSPAGTRLVSIADSKVDVDGLWEALNLSAHENYGVNRAAVFPGVRQAAYEIAQPKLKRQPPSNQRHHLVSLTVLCEPRFPMKQALKLTHRLHQSLAARCPAPVFTGMEMGQPSDSHDHTVFQCIPDRTGRYIEQIQLYSDAGYNQSEMAVIASACSSGLNGVARGYDVSLSLADFGSVAKASADWVSATPFFLTRFPTTRRGKPRMVTDRHQKDGAEHQALKYLHHLAWLDLAGKPDYRDHDRGLALYLNNELAVIAQCEPFPQFWEWEAECRQGRKVGRLGYRVKLQFALPTAGPVVLGYAAHFGLGAMTPVRESVGVQRVNRQKAQGVVGSAN